MDSYRIDVTSSARKDLHRLPQTIAVRAAAVIESLQVEPRGPGVVKMIGSEGYRARLPDSLRYR